jgi:hypothetical protein
VDLLRGRRVGLQVARYAIVEPHAERDQEVRFLDSRVHPGFAVHAHHAQVERMRRRETTDPEQRHRHRHVRLLGERLERRFGAAEDDAVSGEDQRPFSGVDQFGRIDTARMPGAQRHRSDSAPRRNLDSLLPALRVFRGVEDRPPAGRSRRSRRFADGVRDIGGARSGSCAGDRQRDAGNVVS